MARRSSPFAFLHVCTIVPWQLRGRSSQGGSRPRVTACARPHPRIEAAGYQAEVAAPWAAFGLEPPGSQPLIVGYSTTGRISFCGGLESQTKRLTFCLALCMVSGLTFGMPCCFSFFTDVFVCFCFR